MCVVCLKRPKINEKDAKNGTHWKKTFARYAVRMGSSVTRFGKILQVFGKFCWQFISYLVK